MLWFVHAVVSIVLWAVKRIYELTYTRTTKREKRNLGKDEKSWKELLFSFVSSTNVATIA